jgi:hypothetical protein
MVLVIEIVISALFYYYLNRKKNSLQTCFNQISRRCRHSGVGLRLEEKERARQQTATGILTFR